MRPSVMLKTAHARMVIPFMLCISALYAIFGLESMLSIPLLIFLHIFFVLNATIFKVSYVIRLNALKHLGRPVH